MVEIGAVVAVAKVGLANCELPNQSDEVQTKPSAEMRLPTRRNGTAFLPVILWSYHSSSYLKMMT